MNRSYPLIEASVMGRGAVMSTSLVMALAGFAQLFEFPGSQVVLDVGGGALDKLWAISLILGCAFVWIARFNEDSLDPKLSYYWEIAGIAMMCIGFVTYLWALYESPSAGIPEVQLTFSDRIAGKLFVIALVSVSIWNTLGRAVLLIRRILVVRRARR